MDANVSEQRWFPVNHARHLTAAALTLCCTSALAACAPDHRTAAPAIEPAATPMAAAHPDQVGTDQTMRALKQGIDDLADSDFADLQFLDRYLSTNLSAQQQEEAGNPRLLLRSSGSGRFAGVNVRRVELITWKGGDPSLGRLVIDLAEPGPSAEAFATTYWPGAEYSPGRPHAPGSPSVWTTKQGRGSVSIFHTQGDDRIVRVGWSHEP